MSECSHRWKTCPVHSVPTGLPSFETVLVCLYGDCETKDGRPVDRTVAREMIDRMFPDPGADAAKGEK